MSAMAESSAVSPRPSVTVVTVSYNAADSIEKTIENVLTQRGIDLEYVVVEGGSTDGTQSLVERYRDSLAV